MPEKRSGYSIGKYFPKKFTRFTRKKSGVGAQDDKTITGAIYKGNPQPDSIFDNICLLTDSYKMSHYQQYPVNPNEGTKLASGQGSGYVFSYFEARHKGAGKSTSKESTSPINGYSNGFDYSVFFGLQYFIKRYLFDEVVTEDKVNAAEKIVNSHIGKGQFNKEGWMHIVNEHNGRLPIRIDAVEEGSVVPRGHILFSVVNTDPKCYWLPNLLETLLVQVWYPTTIATQSRYQKQILIDAFQKSAGNINGLQIHLHDFGFRGVSSVESSGIGGAAHLISFEGTDTMSALTTINEYYPNGVESTAVSVRPNMAAISIPAAEHSTITSWGQKKERDAYKNMLIQYAGGVVAVVTDSYNMYKTCAEIWPSLRNYIDGVLKLIIRPDSGTAEKILPVLMGLLAYNMCLTGDLDEKLELVDFSVQKESAEKNDIEFAPLLEGHHPKLQVFDGTNTRDFKTDIDLGPNGDFEIHTMTDDELEYLGLTNESRREYDEMKYTQKDLKDIYGPKEKPVGTYFKYLRLKPKPGEQANKWLILPGKLRLIQGDGVSPQSLKVMCDSIMDKGWSIVNCAFGSGGALLQKVNRDTQECAFKCSKILKTNEKFNQQELLKELSTKGEDVFKMPIGESGKASKSGVLKLIRDDEEKQSGFSNVGKRVPVEPIRYATVDMKKFPDETYPNLLKTVFLNGELKNPDDDFGEIRDRSNTGLKKYISLQLKELKLKHIKDAAASYREQGMTSIGGSRKRYRRHRKRHSRKLKKRHTKKRYPKRRRQRKRSRKHRY